ncbi:hypothetical protein ACEQPO_16410 [Bacillus sp. SL00103]
MVDHDVSGLCHNSMSCTAEKETTEETIEVAVPKQAPVTTPLINESGQK